jgi:hypothetical protein
LFHHLSVEPEVTLSLGRITNRSDLSALLVALGELASALTFTSVLKLLVDDVVVPIVLELA